MRRLGLLLILICCAMAFIDIVEAEQGNHLPALLEKHNRMVEQFEQQQRHNEVIRGQRNLQRQIDALATQPVQQYQIPPMPELHPHVTTNYSLQYDMKKDDPYTACIKGGHRVEYCREKHW